MRARVPLAASCAALLFACASSGEPREPEQPPEPEAVEVAEPDPAPEASDLAPEASDPSPEAGAAGPAPEEPPANPLADWSSDVGLRGVSNDGTWRVKYVTEPDPIPLNEPFAVEVAVFAADDTSRPAAGIELALDAAMPQHRHGMLRIPRVEARPDGTFAVTGVLFHMPGYWELYLDVTEGAVTERAQFAVEID